MTSEVDDAGIAEHTQVWFSSALDDERPEPFCLVCWAHGGVITRHRARPTERPLLPT